MVEVILPVLNEATAIPWVLARMPEGFDPVVVDNGSTDGSAEIASALGARVVEESHRGFGAACLAGLAVCTADVVAFMDCDASLDPSDLTSVAHPVSAGQADLVMGRRVPVTRGAWPLHARLANRFLAARVSRPGDQPLRDLGPMRAARRERLAELGLADTRFGFPLEMVVKARAAGWLLAEVPVRYLPRAGRSKVTGTVAGTLRAVADMSRVLRSDRVSNAAAREMGTHW